MNLAEKLKTYRLSQQEYEKICELLGREPRGIEWALFSALWSEHCSYKSSKVHLKKFYSKNERVLESFGENAGVIDLGQGERVAFKMESHNHPSFIEPYQGAATGVGGILRDIFTMGARPIALANYLCFGEPEAPRMESLVDGVVRGIGGYGNCVGVPTLTGQTEFHKSYNGNILVNALALGVFRPGDPIVNSKASGPGNYVVYVGAKTGRDGVHGASMASESFDEDSESKRPTVQIGDPFFEKLLIESCLEVMQKGLVVAIQDMGAAGLTSSSFEMAAKGGVGLTLHLDKVPLRDKSIHPEEILLSESQERMLLVCEPVHFEELQKVFSHWNLDAQVVGEVLSERVVKLYWQGECLTSLDPLLLTDSAPQYERTYQAWEPRHRVSNQQDCLLDVEDINAAVLKTLKDVRGTNRSFVYRQYDQRVGASTIKDCTESVGVVRLPDSGRSLALVLGCRPHVMRWDSQQGGMDAIFYPCLELAAKGFLPLAVTDCLNFGNPEKPELMSEFVAAVEAMSEACRELDTPVISGNVSFYNETLDQNVTSTPSTGIVGMRNKWNLIPGGEFKNQDDEVWLLSLPQVYFSGMWSEVEEKDLVGCGQIEAHTMAQFVKYVLAQARRDFVTSSRVVGKFGLAYALAKMTLSGLGCDLKTGDWLLNPNSEGASLLGEALYQVIFTTRPGQGKKMLEDLNEQFPDLKGEVQLWKLGEVKGDRLKVGQSLDLSVKEIQQNYSYGLEGHFEQLA